MSQQDLNSGDRGEAAAKIIAHPAGYKICEQCDSIVSKRAAHCPNCNGYRFNDEASAVVEQAKHLASRPQTSVTDNDLL